MILHCSFGYIIMACGNSSTLILGLLNCSLRTAEIKLIDFGSACMEEQTVYSYIQVCVFLQF